MHVPVSERFTVDADANRLEAALLEVFYSSASCKFFLDDVIVDLSSADFTRQPDVQNQVDARTPLQCLHVCICNFWRFSSH